MVADIVRSAGYEVVDLGCNVPAMSLAKTVADTEDLVAIAISATNSAELSGLTETVDAIRATNRSVPLILGGSAIRDQAHAEELGADHWAAENAIEAWEQEAAEQVQAAIATAQQEPTPDPYREVWGSIATKSLIEGSSPAQ